MSETPELTRLTPLIEEAAAVSGEGDLGRVLATLVGEAKSATGAPYAALGVLGEHGVLSEFLYHGIDEEQARAIGHPPTGRGVLGTVIRENKTLLLDSIADHPDSVGFPDHHPPMSSFLGVPVAVGEEAFGNIYLTDKEGGFTTEDVAVVQALSRIAGAAVLTARLQTRLRRMAIVEDRQRIARDLHDSVIQDLFAVGLSLQGLANKVTDEGASTELVKAVDTLDESVNALRRYIFELKETSHPSTDLDDRMQSLVARIGAAYPARVELSMDPVPSGPWDDDVVLIATEALSNALRHSGAEKVEVLLTRDDSELVLRVTDDGKGFETVPLDQGMGLANMRARAQSLGGSVTIMGAPARGTTIVARIPVSLARAPEPGHWRGGPSSP